jgi:phospholipid/cholesterol/gamma-HCH transport system ATP-binding protein
MSAPPESSLDLYPVPDAVVDIENLRSAFSQNGVSTVIHQQLHLTVRAGELLSVVGGSGSGKTVLLRQILGLATPAQGRVTVLGRPAAELARQGAASRVGMLFQHGALFSAFNVLENIALPLRELGTLPPALVYDVAMMKLQMVGLDASHAFKMPANLSGGMIKRVALARALILDPPLLLLDEPTAGLDPDSADSFCHLLRSLQQELGLTVMMVTHDLDTIFELSTRIAVIAEKRVIIHAAVPEVLAFDHPFVRQFFAGGRGQRAMNLLSDTGMAQKKES